MTDVVKPDRRAQRRAETERRLVDAAAALFVDRGYAATTLTDVAARADVAPRTLYLHFATKAELLIRCIGVAIASQPTFADAMSAPTLKARLNGMAEFTAGLMQRTGALLNVAAQAESSEPAVAAAAAAGRAETRRTLLAFWRRIHADGLLPRKVDLEWLAETATLMCHAETYLLISKTTAWSTDAYRDWLATTWLRLAASA